MRAAAILVIALLLAGCEHVYGGVDRTFAQAPNEADLVAIAAKALTDQGLSLEGLAPSVADAGKTWRVRFAPSDERTLDGGVTAEISKYSRRVVRHWFDA